MEQKELGWLYLYQAVQIIQSLFVPDDSLRHHRIGLASCGSETYKCDVALHTTLASQ